MVAYAGVVAGQAAPAPAAGADVLANFRLRYEDVATPLVAPADASALTLRSGLQFNSGNYRNLTATLEVENVAVIGGVDRYSLPQTGLNPGRYQVIADPESTEINQAYVNYTSGGFTARVGRQAINLDNQRFVGSVAWRQDWQVFDAVKADYAVNDKLKLGYSFLDKRKRIFADAADIDGSDHLIRAAYEVPGFSLLGYAWLLEETAPVANALDTYGVRMTGGTKLQGWDAGYTVELATQEMTRGSAVFDAAYFALEGRLTTKGITTRLGYESLGSDSGRYGFATPLATLHLFNGWADMFLATPGEGLVDRYLGVGGKVLGGTWEAVLHDFTAAKAMGRPDDFGHETDLQFVRPFGPYTLGVKYADFGAGALPGKPDTRKFWLWLQASF